MRAVARAARGTIDCGDEAEESLQGGRKFRLALGLLAMDRSVRSRPPRFFIWSCQRRKRRGRRIGLSGGENAGRRGDQWVATHWKAGSMKRRS